MQFKDKPRHQKFYVHRLVLETFVGPCPPGMESCHGPGGSSDNRVLNLRWDSRQANSDDQDLHGTRAKGERIHCSKLTESKVIEMRQRYEAGDTCTSIASWAGVAISTTYEAIIGTTWGHVPGAVPTRDKKK